MGRRNNEVALATGAARGRGRAQEPRLARERADTVAVDHGGLLRPGATDSLGRGTKHTDLVPSSACPRPGSYTEADVSARPAEVGNRGSGPVR